MVIMGEAATNGRARAAIEGMNASNEAGVPLNRVAFLNSELREVPRPSRSGLCEMLPHFR